MASPLSVLSTSVLNDQRDPLPGTRHTSARSRTLPRDIAIFIGRQEVPVHRAVQRVRLLRRPGGLQDICGRLGPRRYPGILRPVGRRHAHPAHPGRRQIDWRTTTGTFARPDLSWTRVAMRRFVPSKMQGPKQIQEAGGRRSASGVFEDRTRRLKALTDGVVIRRRQVDLSLDRRHVRAKLRGAVVRTA